MLAGVRVPASAFVLAVLCTGVVQAQSGPDIMERMLTEYERRAENVQDYTLVQETMGVESVSYFEKEMVNGRSVFRLRSAGAAGTTLDEPEGDEGGWDDFYTSLPQLVSRAMYGGSDQIDGNAVHIVQVNDLHELGFGPAEGGEHEDFQAENGKFFIDDDEWIVRRMEFDGRMTNQGETHDVTSIVDFSDFREVEGMIHPFHISVAMEGLGEAMGPEVRAQMEEMKKQLENMPEDQRKMMEEMMQGQMAQLEGMMGGEGLKIEIRVKEIRVNTGPGGE